MTFSELAPQLPAAALGILAADFLRYFVTAALVHGLVWKLFGKALAGRRIASQGPKPGQVWREFGHSMSTVALFAGTGFFIFTMQRLGWTQIYTDVADRGWAWWWASLAIIILLHDTWFYWTHRLLHRPWWFARFHATHHQSVHPTPWAAYSFHPTEALIQALFFVIMVHVVPMHEVGLFVFTTWMIVRNVVGHSAHELMPWQATAHGSLRWLLTNSHHHYHHSAGRGNFGLYFTWWDRAMGTEDRSYIENGDERFLGSGKNGGAAATLKTVAAMALASGLTAAVLLAAPEGQAQTSAQAQATALADEWWTPGFAARVKLAACGDDKDAKAGDAKLCGAIVWAWDDTPAGASDKRPLVGQRIIRGMRPDAAASGGPTAAGGTARYAGSIYNPEDGQTYKATMRLKTANTLLVEGCVLFICREQVWRRWDSLKTPPVAMP